MVDDEAADDGRGARPTHRRGRVVTEAVLEAGLATLAAAGLDGLTVEGVARSAGVDRATVYRRWPTRAALVAAVLERILQDASAPAPAAGPRDQLVSLVLRLGRFLATDLGAAVAMAAMDAREAPEVRALAARKLATLVPGATDGDPTMDPRLGPGTGPSEGVGPREILELVVGAVLHRVLIEAADVSEAWAERIVDTVLRGARSP